MIHLPRSRAASRRIGHLLSAGSCALLLSGCSHGLLSPAGYVSQSNRDLLLIALGLMAVVVLPVFILMGLVIWRFRQRDKDGNTVGGYYPDWDFSLKVEGLMWGVPAIIVAILGVFLWIYTHRLDPYEPIEHLAGEPYPVQAIGLDWKWVFLYPEDGFATVNRLVFPADRQIALKLTTDATMMSFFIPQLGSQIYAMAGMQTQLHLAADNPGTFRGINSQYNGIGFAEQNFAADGMTDADFEAFVRQARGEAPLSEMRYQQLVLPSVVREPEIFGGYPENLFSRVMMSYMGGVRPPVPPDAAGMSTATDMQTAVGSGINLFSSKSEYAPIDRGEGPRNREGQPVYDFPADRDDMR